MAAPVQLTNFIVNPGAEVDTSYWESGWWTNNVTLTRDTGAGNFFGGSAGFKVVGTGAGASEGTSTRLASIGGAMATGGSIVFQAGRTYTFEVYIKSSSGATALALLLGVGPPSPVGDASSANITITTSWAKYAVSWTPAKDTANASAVIMTQGTAAATYYFDNAIVTESSGVGYFDGTTEGCQWLGTAHASMSRSPASFTNIVPNPGFQADTYFWRTNLWATNPAAFARVADSDADSGYALRVTCPGSLGSEGVEIGVSTTNALTLRPGVKYLATFKLKRAYGANIHAVAGQTVAPYWSTYIASALTPPSGSYQTYSYVFTAAGPVVTSANEFTLAFQCGSTTATLFFIADVSVIPLGAGTGITQTTGETLLIDPWSEDAANVQLDLADNTAFFLLAHDYPVPDRDSTWGSSADTEGEALVQHRYKNREITAKLRVIGTSASDIATKLGYLQQKIAKLNREGGTLKRMTPNSDPVIFDVLGADLDLPQDKRYMASNRVKELTVKFACRPFGRGPAITLGDKAETTLPYVSQVETAIKGDVPALGRLVIDEDQAVNQWTAMWGIQSRYYDSASSAALFFQAEGLTLQGAGAATSTAAAGYSGSGSVLANALATSYQSILSSQATGGGAHWSHIGDFRVYARVFVPTGNTGQVSVRARWTVGDGRVWTQNDETALDANVKGVWRMVDLGMVSIPKAAAGTQRWELQFLAKSTVAGDDIHVDWYLLMPASEGFGVASGIQAAIDYSSFQARDEFNQSAGALAGKTPNTGGNWAGAGDADDFNVSGSGTVTRTAVSDTATNMSNARLETMATPASLAGLLAYVVQKTDAYNSTLGHGLLLRYTDTSNFLAVYATYSAMSGTNLTVNIRTRVAGTETTIGTAYITSILPTSNYVLAASVGADGQVIVSGAPEGIGWSVLASGYSADLATGGTLASGKVGLFDWITGGTACTRTYSAFGAYGVNADYAVPASQSLEIRHDRVIREDSGGTLWQPPSSYKGDYLLIPPAGRENRSCRWIVKMSRGPIATGADGGIDDASARLTYVPRFLVVPEP